MPPEFSVRSDSVDVEQIMTQIRARIREKRGVDYTEEELRELASVKLEKFLDPTRVRSDLILHYRQHAGARDASARPPPPENYAFDDHRSTSRRGARRADHHARPAAAEPVLKLFINPNPIIQVLNRQSAINAYNTRQEFDRTAALNYEVIHNLVLEMTRLSIEVKNLKMRVESLSGRLDFSDRRARALESVVQYRPGTGPAAELAEAASAPAAAGGRASRRDGDAPRREGEAARREGEAAAPGGPIKGEAQRARRRRRRRGRGGAPASPRPTAAPAATRRRAGGRGGARRGRARVAWRRRRQSALRRRRARTRERHTRPARATRRTSETRRRRPAVRPRHQRRRRTPRPLRGRAPGAPRRRRRADHLRPRLRHVAERAARRRVGRSTACACGASRCERERDPERFGRRSRHVFESAHSVADELRVARQRGPDARRRSSTTSAATQARLRLLHLLQLPVLPRVPRRPRGADAGRSSCRRPSATARSACRSSPRSSAACARSCTTRSKSGR